MSFADDIEREVARLETELTDFFRRSVLMLILEVITPIFQGGRLPYRTGNLQRSLWVSTAGPAMVAGNRDKFDTMQDFNAVLNAFDLGDTVHISLRAAYAFRLNYGFVGEDSLGRYYNQSGYGFMEAAALQWPRIWSEQAASIQW